MIADKVLNQLLLRSNVVNNALTTEEGYALDARMGKSLQDQITAQNSNFKNYVRIDGSSISGYGGMGSSFNTGVTLINDAGNAGMPTAEWYMLISAGGDGTRCQLAVALFTGKIYWRNCAAGKWSEWVQKV